MGPECCILHINDVVDGYTIVDKLGEGTFGNVYKATDKTGKVYALKLLKLWSIVKEDEQKSLLGRFNMEFETGKIDSKYLVHSISYGSLKGNPYILMEYCPNGDLKKYVGKKIPNNQIDNIAYNILKGLNDLHINGKVHRDLKPENVLFDENEQAKLTDFGISGDKNKRMTKVDIFGNFKEIFGTYAYMPKEQLNPKKDVTVLPTTDIFSFGVVMYELLTGTYPFGTINDNNELAEYNRRKSKGLWNDKLLLGNNVDAKWIDIIGKSLNPDYSKRFQSTIEIIKLLGFEPENTEKSGETCLDYNFYTDKIGLKVMQGEEYGRIYNLSEILPESQSGLIRVGRKSSDVDNDLEIYESLSTYVSRRHATIEKNYNQGKWFIRDGQWKKNVGWISSTNGTYINSIEVSEQGMELNPNNIISIGDVTLKVIKL